MKVTKTGQLTLEGAKVMGEAAEAEAARNGWRIAVAVVDAGGHPLYFARMDGALLASCDGALFKAKTAVMFRRTTKQMAADLAAGRLHVLAFDEVLPAEGGIPANVDGEAIGGIGVGGTAKGADATQCAEAGLAALC